jgi:hypothetical protein
MALQRAVQNRRRNKAQKQRLPPSRHLSLNPAKVHGDQSTLIISRLRGMLNSALNIGRLLATYRSWAFDVFRSSCDSILDIANESSLLRRDFSDHRTDASEQR